MNCKEAEDTLSCRNIPQCSSGGPTVNPTPEYPDIRYPPITLVDSEAHISTADDHVPTTAPDDDTVPGTRPVLDSANVSVPDSSIDPEAPPLVLPPSYKNNMQPQQV